MAIKQDQATAPVVAEEVTAEVSSADGSQQRQRSASATTPEYPPFMNASTTVGRILEKIKQAETPERFTQDFLSTVLGFPGGSPRSFIGFAKRIGLLNSDGTPTDLYRKFRNPNESGAAMAAAMRHGYKTLFARNQYADRLERKKLEGLVMEATGLKASAPALRAIVGTFETLKGFADFGAQPVSAKPEELTPIAEPGPRTSAVDLSALRFSYTINLNLPASTDVSVFNAIFKSLRENLLTD